MHGVSRIQLIMLSKKEQYEDLTMAAILIKPHIILHQPWVLFWKPTLQLDYTMYDEAVSATAR